MLSPRLQGAVDLAEITHRDVTEDAELEGAELLAADGGSLARGSACRPTRQAPDPRWRGSDGIRSLGRRALSRWRAFLLRAWRAFLPNMAGLPGSEHGGPSWPDRRRRRISASLSSSAQRGGRNHQFRNHDALASRPPCKVLYVEVLTAGRQNLEWMRRSAWKEVWRSALPNAAGPGRPPILPGQAGPDA